MTIFIPQRKGYVLFVIMLEVLPAHFYSGNKTV